MNKKQKIISLTGMTLIILMSLIPPWKSTSTDPSFNQEYPIGYYLIFSPPLPGDDAMVRISLDMSRLAVQWIAVLFVMAGTIFLTQEKRPSDLDEENDIIQL